MGSCTSCGSSVPDGQGSCSMCYGDISYGSDGHYQRWAEEREQEEIADLEAEREQEIRATALEIQAAADEEATK